MKKCNDCKKMVEQAPFGQCDDCFEKSMSENGSVVYSVSGEEHKEEK
jgi:RNA polymerase subunit RPABC4/transcription elongation factor Spt4|tara:strand:- start:53 stop:193 length:141 start_codon:yes stop_codon:yes gene_type:complete